MGTPLGPKYIPYTYMDPLGGREGFLSVVQRTLNQQFLWARAPPNSYKTSTVLHADGLLAV